MNILKRFIHWIKYRNVSGGWMAFCDEHFEEALEHLTKKHSKCDVGYCDADMPEEFEDTEDDQEMLKKYICDYPGCNKYPAKEILWMKPMTEDDLKSSKYVSLEELK
jgi:hypothetical protein